MRILSFLFIRFFDVKISLFYIGKKESFLSFIFRMHNLKAIE